MWLHFCPLVSAPVEFGDLGNDLINPLTLDVSPQLYQRDVALLANRFRNPFWTSEYLVQLHEPRDGLKMLHLRFAKMKQAFEIPGTNDRFDGLFHGPAPLYNDTAHYSHLRS